MAARAELRNALNLNYAKPRRSTNTEANSYVFDTAEVLLRQRGIFDTTKYPQKEKDRYGNHQLGQHMLIGRKLLEAGCRFVNRRKERENGRKKETNKETKKEQITKERKT